MQELIKAIKDWPVIIQGVIGSAGFWLILLAGQKITSITTEYFSKKSINSKITWLTNEHAKCAANLSKSDAEFTIYAVILLYRASRVIIKVFMWLTLGLMFQSFFGPLGIIGFCGAMYYLFKTAEILAPINPEKYSEEMLKELNQKIQEMKEKA